MCDSESILKTTSESTEQEPAILDNTEISSFVSGFLQRRDVFLQACHRYGSPLYVVEESVLIERAEQFIDAFYQVLPDVRIYYAMKSNNHPLIVKTLVNVAVENSDRITVLIDSFGELEHLQRVAVEKDASIRAGVRLAIDSNGLWRKFGIPLKDVSKFLDAAEHCDHVSINGLQFHTSWNLDPYNQVNFIACLGNILSKLTSEQSSMIEFIDIGGGFWPSQGEWLQSSGIPLSHSSSVTKLGSVSKTCHYKRRSTTIEEFAGQIAQAVYTHLFPYVSCRICAEPGRWLCNDAMHLLLTVLDKKAKDLVITDAGTNAIGWERFETDYFPVINLSRAESIEHECYILGSLCTPHDVWGYTYWGKGIEPGDILMIPTQGAYTYSLRQEFIKPLPKVVMLDKKSPQRS